MKVIKTKTHGYLDYIIRILLIASPWIFNFYDNGAETWVPVILGIGMIIYSLITNYELGVAHIIPMKTHLMIDFIAGALLAISPWLFGFADRIWEPHLILGILEMGAALMTKNVPGTQTRTNTSHTHTAAMH